MENTLEFYIIYTYIANWYLIKVHANPFTYYSNDSRALSQPRSSATYMCLNILLTKECYIKLIASVIRQVIAGI